MKSILFTAFAGILFSCNQKSHTHEKEATFDIEPVKAHIIEMNKSYSKRFVTNDTSFYNERYCKDAEVYCPAVPAVKGRDSIRAFFYSSSNNEAVIELPIGKVYGDGDLVVEEGTYNFPDSKGGSVDKGKFIALWKQEDGKWKLYREIWNTDLPPAPSK